jgi:hypothetical protein
MIKRKYRQKMKKLASKMKEKERLNPVVKILMLNRVPT